MVATGFAQGDRDGASMVVRLVETDGSATHRWATALAGVRAGRRDLADAAHALCMLHGNHPGLADDARARRAEPGTEAWFATIADGFAAERAALALIVSAAGPLPSTPGQADSENAILVQRRALTMLAGSDRRGCALGAVMALALDWRGVRAVLDRAAATFGVDLAPAALPATSAADAGPIAMPVIDPAADRAITFGAQQLLAQQRGLWSLLEARAEARDRS